MCQWYSAAVFWQDVLYQLKWQKYKAQWNAEMAATGTKSAFSKQEAENIDTIIVW